MKPYKFIYYVFAAMLVVIISCNNEEEVGSVKSVKTNAPVLKAVIGDYSNANQVVVTKAGVVEEFEGYKSEGERFYWHDGDKIDVYFFKDNNLDSFPTKLTYTASVPQGIKKNKCDLMPPASPTTDLEINTNYSIIAFFPADSVKPTLVEQNPPVYGAFEVNVTGKYEQEDTSSKHLGLVLFMVSYVDDIYIEDDKSCEVNMNFEQLTSVLRFRITDEKIHVMPDFSGLLQLEYLKIYTDNEPFFVKNAYFDGFTWELLPNDEVYPNYLLDTIRVDVNQEFIDIEGVKSIDVYMPVLPTGALGQSNNKLIIEAGLRYVIGGVEQSDKEFFSTENGLSFNQADELDFLGDGFRGGYSYWFDLKIKE